VFFVEVAIGVELFQLPGLFFGAGVAVLLEANKDAADTSHGIDEADVFVGIAFDFASDGHGFEVVKEFAHLGGGDLERDFGQLGGVFALKEVGKGFLAGVEVVAPILVAEPGLVREFLVLGEVVCGEVFAVVAELVDDDGVGDAVENGVIDLVTDRFGEAGDFAVAGAGGAGGGGEFGRHKDFGFLNFDF
jgi:hypothetical protein